jgi:2-oxoglutarate dehydrogenase E1 component
MPFDPHTASAEYIDELYEQYRTRPESLDSQWVAFFRGFDFGSRRAEAGTAGDGASAIPPDKGVHGLVQAYRQLGHFVARVDPLGHHRDHLPLLDLNEYGLEDADLDRVVGTGGFLGPTDGTLRSLLAALQTTYCGSLAVEYLSIADKAQRDWLQAQIEPGLNQPTVDEEDDRRILARLVEAEEFEQFLHTRYVGQKRFSLEGSESLIPLLETLVIAGADLGVTELVIGMAHRGRLNVLAHLLHKPYEVILSEFEGALQSERADNEGDVKYHMGYSHDMITESGHKVHLSLSSNPSHLELVNPVIEGSVYAKQSYLRDRERRHVVPLLIHGDAAFAGQGIVTETLHLSQLDGYTTGGTVHVIINNQLGYTATPPETRFTPYPTDVARQMQAPVFHVNADDVESVVRAARLAIAFRQTFRRDVFIDLWAYRRYGHNEADDPTLTQPVMYRQIGAHPTVARLYAARLAGDGRVSDEDFEDLRTRVRARLDDAQMIARRLQMVPRAPVFGGVWQGLTWAGQDWGARTAVDRRLLEQVVSRATTVPPGFALHRTLERLVRARREMVDGTRPVDWGCAEMLAFGTLLLEGLSVRLVGQDSQRGTFAHRHAVWHDVETGALHVPLAHLSRDQAEFNVHNTMLSELAVLGFEYGVSTTDPRRLVLWEAQFGDFANGAQMIIDQFLVAGEAKWQRMCGLVLLLPHGYEGMGPEHSSARLERFLQLAAKNNIQVVYPSTPAQLFHVLRRQMHRNFRKPLVVMTPKSLLRHKLCVSPLDQFTDADFRPVLADDDPAVGDDVRRLLLCSGKIHYDLAEARQQSARRDVALARLEQLYPFPRSEMEDLLARYPRLEEVYWVQEESQNMGAWSFVRPLLEEVLPVARRLGYVGRDEAASPATGSHHVHQSEQQEILVRALAAASEEVPMASGHRDLSR